MTRNQIGKLLTTIASQHRQIRTAKVVKADYFLHNEIKDVTYPACWFTIGETTRIDGKSRIVPVLVTLADIVHHPDQLHEEVKSDMEQVANDLVGTLDWDKFEWNLERATTYEFFEDQYEDELAGVTFSVDLRFPFNYNACELPSDYELPSGDFVYINTSRFMNVADFIVGPGAAMVQGDTTYQNNLLTVPPFVFIDGLLLTYTVRSDRRYVVHNATTKEIEIIGGVNEGENIRILI